MENQQKGKAGANALPPHLMQETNLQRQPSERASRFSVQRMDTADLGSMMPRRRSSVNHGQSGTNRPEFAPSSYVTVEDVDISHHTNPSAGRKASVRDPSSSSKGLKSDLIWNLFTVVSIFIIVFWINSLSMLPSKLAPSRFGVSFKAHLRDSVRTTRTLQHHLSRETLPSLRNYNPHSGPTRATLEELHLGTELSIQKVNKSLRREREVFRVNTWLLGYWVF